jgi:hypothetical protein
MKLSQLKSHLSRLDELQIFQPDGTPLPAHFHITEAGLMTKHFIDCGGIIRTEKHATMQIWVADDVDHRLSPKKLAGILEKASPLFGNEDPEVEVEYQSETIGRYGLQFENGRFVLMPTFTDCLAKEKCGIDSLASESKSSPLQQQKVACCSPAGGCC